MPPKRRIDRAVLLEHAFRIAEERGIMAVTSRSVAEAAGCSVQPVFSHFPTMEALRRATFAYACDRFVNEILAFEQRPDFFPQVTKWVVDLARHKPHLFRMLYLGDGFSGNDLPAVMMAFESNRRIVAKMTALYGLDAPSCEDILLRASLFLLGLCTMICVNHMAFSDAQVAELMRRTVADLVAGAKGGAL